MNKIKEVVLGTKKYFQETFSNNVLKKVTSLVIVACFVLNVANLPAFAESKSKYEEQQKFEEMKKEKDSAGVSYIGDQTTGSVLFMQYLSDNVEVDDNGVIYKKEKDEKGKETKKAVGTWDGTTAKIVDGEGKFVANKAYTDAINIKLNKAQEELQTSQSLQEKSNVIENLSQQSGLSKEEVEKQLEDSLADKDEEYKESVISTLSNFFDNNGQIVNCATETLSNVLSVTSKGVLGLQALLADVSAGLFSEKNVQIVDGVSQLSTSAQALEQVLNENKNNNYNTYSVSTIEDLVLGLENGDIVLNVKATGSEEKANHYITLSKNEENNIVIKDANKEDVVVSQQDLETYLKENYNFESGAMLANGDIESLTKLSAEEKEKVLGSKINLNSVKNSFSKAATTVGKAVTTAAKTTSKAVTTAAKTTSKAVTTAAKTTSKAVTTAAKTTTTTKKATTTKSSSSSSVGSIFSGALSTVGSFASAAVNAIGSSSSKKATTTKSSSSSSVGSIFSGALSKVGSFATTAISTIGSSSSKKVTTTKSSSNVTSLFSSAAKSVGSLFSSSSSSKSIKPISTITSAFKNISTKNIFSNNTTKSLSNTNVFKGIVNNFGNAVSKIGTTGSKITSGTGVIKSFTDGVSGLFTGSKIGGSIKNINVSNIFNNSKINLTNIVKNPTSVFNNVKTSVSSVFKNPTKLFNNTKTKLVDVFGTAKTNVASVFKNPSNFLNNTKNTIVDSFNVAKTKSLDIFKSPMQAIDNIKSKTSISFSNATKGISNIIKDPKSIITGTKERLSNTKANVVEFFKDPNSAARDRINILLGRKTLTGDLGTAKIKGYKNNGNGSYVVDYDDNGVSRTMDIVLSGANSNQQSAFNKKLKSGDLSGALDYVDSKGVLDKQVVSNDKGKTIYKAENVGYDAKTNTSATQYSFWKRYTDNVLFTNILPGMKKIVFNTYDSNSNKKSTTVYSSLLGKIGSAKTESGMKISSSISKLDKVINWTTEKDKSTGKTNVVANVVDFVGKLGSKASGFEKIVVDSVTGNKNITRYDLTDAYTNKAKETIKSILNKSAGSGSSSSSGKEKTLVDEFASVLNSTTKLKNRGLLYKGFESINNDNIDLSKISTYVFNTNQSNLLTKIITGEKSTTSILAELSNTSNWRYNIKLSKNSSLNTVDTTTYNDDGTSTRSIFNGVKLRNNFTYTQKSLDNANATILNFDKLNKLISGSVRYKAGTEISPLFDGNLLADTVKIDRDIISSFVVKNNKLVATSGDLNVTGTYINRYDGAVQATGKLENTKIALNSQGLLGLTGKVNIDAGSLFRVSKGSGSSSESGSGSGGGSAPDAKDTFAVINEFTDEYQVSNGSISLRGGQLVVVGEGARAKSGSQLFSGYGKVTTSGIFQYKDGLWQGTKGATFRFNNIPEAISKLREGLLPTGLKSIDSDATLTKYLSRSFSGPIYTDAVSLFYKTVLPTATNGLNVEVIDNKYSLGSIDVYKGGQFNIKLKNGSYVYTAKNNLTAGTNVGNGAASWLRSLNNGSAYVTGTVKAGQQITPLNIFRGSGQLDRIASANGIKSNVMKQAVIYDLSAAQISNLNIGYSGTKGAVRFLQNSVLDRNGNFINTNTISAKNNTVDRRYGNTIVSKGQYLQIRSTVSANGQLLGLSIKGNQTVPYSYQDKDGSIKTAYRYDAFNGSTIDSAGNRVSGRFIDYSSDGKYNESYSFAFKGTFDAKNGKVSSSGGGSGSGGSSSIVTQGILDKTSKSGHTIIRGTSDRYAIVTKVNGEYQTTGDGIIAWNGSKLPSAGGPVITSGGDFVSSGGSWYSNNGGTYTYADPTKAAAALTKSFANSGLVATGLDKFDYTQSMSGPITNNAETMFRSLLSVQSAEVAKQGADFINQSGKKYSTLDGFTFGNGADFNISIQEVNGQNAITYKANNTLDVSCDLDKTLGKNWKVDNNESKRSFTGKFNSGEYITVASVLDKAGVKSLTGKDINWNGTTVPSVKVNIAHLENTGYDNIEHSYFALAQTGTIENKAKTSITDAKVKISDLKGKYNDTDFYVLAGSKVNIFGDKLQVINGDVYTEGMNTSIVNNDSKDGSSSQGGSGSKISSYFAGEITKDKKGNTIATGVFHNYSDETIAQVFSETTVYNVGSVFIKGSNVNNLGIITDGEVTIKSIEEGKINYAGFNGTATYDNVYGKTYTIDKLGNIEFQMKESDVSTGDNQKVIKYNGKFYVVNKDDALSYAGEGFFNLKDNDVKASDGKYYDIDALQEIVEIADKDGKGTGLFVGIKKKYIGDEQRSGLSDKDDLYAIVNGKTLTIDKDGYGFGGGLDSTIKLQVSNPNIDKNEIKTISITDLNKNLNENTRSMMLDNGSVIYVDSNSLGMKNERYEIKQNDGSIAVLNIDYRTETTKTQHDGSGGNDVEKVKITYTVDGVNYEYDGDRNKFFGGKKTEYELKTDSKNGDRYVNLDFSGNQFQTETVLVGKRDFLGVAHDRVSVTQIDYCSYADGSGYQTEYNDFIGEYTIGKDGSINVDKIVNSSANSTHNSRAVTTTWDKLGRTTSVDDNQYTWTGAYKKSNGDGLGRATTINVKEGSYRENYTYSSDKSITPICTSRIEYSGTMKNITYDKNQIESFTPSNYKETTILYNGVDKEGKRIEVSRNTEIKNGYSETDKKQLTDWLKKENPSITTKEINDIVNKKSQITYQYVDGVKYEKEISNIKVDSYGSVNGQKEEFLKTNYINSQIQETTQGTTTKDKDEDSTSYKTITTVLSKQDIITAYNNVGDNKVDSAVRTVLETPQTNSKLYDDNNRVVYETQQGGIFKTTAIFANDTEVAAGQVLKYGKLDKATSYKYGENGSIESNTIAYDYNYLDQSGVYKNASNGTVTISATNVKGNILTETTTESATYSLLGGTKDKNGKENILTRTADYDAGQLTHDYSYQQSVSLGALGISGDGNIKNILLQIGNLGDENLTNVASQLTDEQLRRLVSSDKYTVYGVNADLIGKTVSIDSNVSINTDYDARGNIVKSVMDGGDTGGTRSYTLSDTGAKYFTTGVNFSDLQNVSFDAQGVYSSKSLIDNAGSSLASQSSIIRNTINNDVSNGSHDILGDCYSDIRYKETYGYKYDSLGREISSNYKIQNSNGTWINGETSTTYSTNKGSTISTKIDSYFTKDENGKIITTTKDPEKSTYGYDKIGQREAIDLSMMAVDKYNDLGDMRDNQRLSRDQTKNTAIKAGVTAVYTVGSVALACLTFGGSSIIQLSATSAISAALSLAAIPSVYKSTGLAAEAVTKQDTQTAVAESAFVALDFLMLGTSFLKGANLFEKAGKAISGTKVGKVLKFINPVSLSSERTAMIFGEGSKITKFLMGETGNALVKTLGKVTNLASSIGLNSAVYGVHIGDKGWNGLLGWGLEKAGLSNIVNNDIYKAATTLLSFSPIFNKEYSRGKNIAKDSADDGKNMVEKFKNAINDGKTIRERFSSSFNNFKTQTLGLADDATLSLKTIGKAASNYASNAVYQSAGMLADITKFNTVVSNGVLGGIKTAVYNLTGAELDGFIFKNTKMFSSGGELLSNAITSSADMVTNPQMWVFSFATPVVTTVMTPLLQSIPGLGQTIRAFNFVSDSVNNEYLSTFIEENIKEEALGTMWSWVPNAQWREILQECFDDTPDGNSLLNYNNQTMRQVSTKVDKLITTTNQTERAGLVADIINNVNSRANALSGQNTRTTSLTARDILNTNSKDSSIYGLLLNSNNLENIKREMGVQIAASNSNSDTKALSQIRKLVNSQNSNVARSSWLNDASGQTGSSVSVGSVATYLQQVAPIILSNKGNSDVINADNISSISSTSLTDYLSALVGTKSQGKKIGLSNTTLQDIQNATTGILDTLKNRGSYEIINAVATAISGGIDTSVLKSYIDNLSFDESTISDVNKKMFNSSLQTIINSLNAEDTINFVANIKSNTVTSLMTQSLAENISEFDLSKYTTSQAKKILETADSVELISLANEILQVKNNNKFSDQILSRLNSIDLSNLTQRQTDIVAKLIATNNISNDISMYEKINDFIVNNKLVYDSVVNNPINGVSSIVAGLQSGRTSVGKDAVQKVKNAASEYLARFNSIKNNVQQISNTRLVMSEQLTTLIQKYSQVSDSDREQFVDNNSDIIRLLGVKVENLTPDFNVDQYINQLSNNIVATYEMETNKVNEDLLQQVKKDYYLTDSQLARIAKMSTKELTKYLQYNLATKEISGLLQNSMKSAVESFIKGKDNYTEQDFEKMMELVNGEKDTVAVLDKNGEEVNVDLNYFKDKYKLESGVPYAVEALKSFRTGQMDAFRDILQSTIEKGTAEEKSSGYAHELQTAGGKSLIGLFTVLTLRGNPNIENKDSKFITWLTNEDSNSVDLYNHMNFVFGNQFGNIELITQANIQQWQADNTLRERLDKAGVVIGTYSGWGSLFSETMAGLVSYSSEETDEIKAQVDYNKSLLKGAGIELIETKLNDAKGTIKVQFANAKDSAKAIEILLANGQGLDRVNLPLDRISQLVADELDYAATIPASALASAAGKFSKQYGLISYYEQLVNGQGENINYEDYAYLGITEEILQTDIKTMETKNGVNEIKQKLETYKTISEKIQKSYSEGVRDQEQIVSDILEVADTLGLSKEKVEEIVSEQYMSIRNLEVRSRLLNLAGDQLSADVDGISISFSDLSKFNEGDKGTSQIRDIDNDDAVIRTVEAEEAQDGYRSNMIENIKSALRNVLNLNKATESVAQEDVTQDKSTITKEQYDKAIENLVDEIYKEYSDIFSSKLELKEFLATGADALSLYTAKESGVGTGGYMVERDEDGNAQNIYITNNGLPMKNLNMPGMWAIELMEGCKDINKPSLETFISSKEALAAFEWSVGFSGTFSSSIRSLLKDLNYAEVGGSMPDTMKVGVTTALTQTQSDIAKVISDARKKLNEQNIAGVDLIMTANFDGTTKIVNDLIFNGTSEEDIVSLSLDLLDSELKKLSDTSKYSSAKVAEVMKNAGVENYSVDALENIDMSIKIKVLQEVLKNVMKSGEVSYIVGDVSLLGRGWNPGKMGSAVETLKTRQKITNDAKVQATMWKVNFEKMDATQSEQGDGRFAHRDGTSRFSSEFFNRDIVQITSVESAKENKILRKAASDNGGYTVDLILANLNDVMEANEESTLQKANNTVINTTKQWAQEQTKQGVEIPTYSQARNNLKETVGADNAGNIINKILEISRVRVSNEDETMTREAWFGYDNYMNYVAACNSLGVSPIIDISNEKLQNILKGDVVSALELISQENSSKNITELIENIRTINENYAQQEGKITSMYQQLSSEDQDELRMIQNGKKNATIVDMIKFAKISKEQKKLNKYLDAFDKSNNALFKELLGKQDIENIDCLGLKFDDNIKSVRFNMVPKDKWSQYNKIITLSQEKGAKKLKKALDKLTVKQITNIVMSKSPSETLLNTIEYFGNKKVIAEEIAKQTDIIKKDEKFIQSELIDKIAQIQAQRKVLDSIGTDKQQIKIKTEDSVLIRTILDLDNEETNISVDAVVNTISNGQEISEEDKKMLETIINGVTAPAELNNTVNAVLAICENADEIANLLGFNEMSEIKDIEAVTKAYYEKVGALLNIENTNKGELEATIAILATARDMLIMVKQEPAMIKKLNSKETRAQDIIEKLTISKAVNHNVLLKSMLGVSESVEKDFVIDVNKIKRAVETKITAQSKGEIIKELSAALLDAGRGSAKDRVPGLLMKISNIHAVAAAA